MRIVKIFLSLILIVGMVCPILSAEVFDMEHRVIFAPISVLCAFFGTGILLGFSGFKTRPKGIGNFDNSDTEINQTWAVFFIALIINLLFANLCG
jgi:hypothetical protein